MILNSILSTERQGLGYLAFVLVVAMLTFGCSKAVEKGNGGEASTKSKTPCKPIPSRLNDESRMESCHPKVPGPLENSQELLTAIQHCNLDELRSAIASSDVNSWP